MHEFISWPLPCGRLPVLDLFSTRLCHEIWQHSGQGKLNCNLNTIKKNMQYENSMKAKFVKYAFLCCIARYCIFTEEGSDA